jgi:hypothetical protein
MPHLVAGDCGGGEKQALKRGLSFTCARANVFANHR